MPSAAAPIVTVPRSPWLLAARPRTLSLSMTPVTAGATLAWAAEHKVAWAAVAVALAGSMLIQAGTNLQNDALDSEPGGNAPDRFGPSRATAHGLLSATAVARGALLCFALTALAGLYLVAVGGWPILLLGLASIASGWTYAGGPRPIAYSPLGELFVIVFFGLGAVGGTYWLCTLHITSAALELGLALGFFTAAVLLVNNRRDLEIDARVGRLTLPMVIGRRATSWFYGAFMLLPFALLPLIARGLPRGEVWPAFAALVPALALIARFAREPRGPGFNAILARTVQVQLLFALLLCGGLILLP
jgi:1,4-dihydroxy-2-naphthoate polyprenyltransferase